jgi:hypothetical protein
MQREFLDGAPENSKCVDLDCEYTYTVKNVKQGSLPQEKKQRNTVPQLSMAYKTLIF